MFGTGPCAMPSMHTPQVPQMPSRQSLSIAIGSSPRFRIVSLSWSTISRNDMFGSMPDTS